MKTIGCAGLTLMLTGNAWPCRAMTPADPPEDIDLPPCSADCESLGGVILETATGPGSPEEVQAKLDRLMAGRDLRAWYYADREIASLCQPGNVTEKCGIGRQRWEWALRRQQAAASVQADIAAHAKFPPDTSQGFRRHLAAGVHQSLTTESSPSNSYANADLAIGVVKELLARPEKEPPVATSEWLKARIRPSSKEDLASIQTNLQILCTKPCTDRAHMAMPIVQQAYQRAAQVEDQRIARETQLEAAQVSAKSTLFGALLGAVVGAIVTSVGTAALAFVVQRRNGAELKATVNSLNATILAAAEKFASRTVPAKKPGQARPTAKAGRAAK
ncbi:MAG: hypothetical protein JSR45_14005 [Proteobacteria bacterium]|nr:hypothetical protein [Pseudomonadota bacterium]